MSSMRKSSRNALARIFTTSVCDSSRSGTGASRGASTDRMVKRDTSPVDSLPPCGLRSRRKFSRSPPYTAVSGLPRSVARLETR